MGLWPRCFSRKLVHAMAVLARFERIGDQHGVVDGRDVDAVAARAPAESYLRFWPILRIDGIFEQRLQHARWPRRAGFGLRSLAGRNQPAALAAMAERNVAGACPGRVASETPTSSACIGIERIRFGVDRDMACSVRRGDPAVERRPSRLHRFVIGMDEGNGEKGLSSRDSSTATGRRPAAAALRRCFDRCALPARRSAQLRRLPAARI